MNISELSPNVPSSLILLQDGAFKLAPPTTLAPPQLPPPSSRGSLSLLQLVLLLPRQLLQGLTSTVLRTLLVSRTYRNPLTRPDDESPIP